MLLMCAILALVPGVALSGPPPIAAAGQARSAEVLSFDGVRYLHRWSKNGHNEYTPADQPDLRRWRQMLTLIEKPGMNPRQMAQWAQATASGFEERGILFGKDQPVAGEYRLLGVLRDSGVVEVNYARFMQANGGAMLLMVQRRFYDDERREMADWVRDNTPRISRRLLDWGPLPKAAALAALPQSESE
ncbi:hypothetical protein EBB59_10610 [Lysobacter pythonis]|uniref:Uncharacterized protein n=2 Tax=Solilutibacter pythonis TaxID=2483112 RepID=A0A3M2HNQ3_9GAMM|nr:hypothetical protein EBB59_10610 [Lysobacter pythonis]